MLPPNIGNTLRPVFMVVTRWGITQPKVNRFGWNLEHSEYIIGGWPLWQIFYAIRTVARAGEPGNFLSGKQPWFYRFPMSQISRNLNITRRSVRRWILSEQNFENFPVMGCFPKKSKKMIFFNVLGLQAAKTWNNYRSTEIHYQNNPLQDV